MVWKLPITGCVPNGHTIVILLINWNLNGNFVHGVFNVLANVQRTVTRFTFLPTVIGDEVWWLESIIIHRL